jgi:hypothetical protein
LVGYIYGGIHAFPYQFPYNKGAVPYNSGAVPTTGSGPKPAISAMEAKPHNRIPIFFGNHNLRDRVKQGETIIEFVPKQSCHG